MDMQMMPRAHVHDVSQVRIAASRARAALDFNAGGCVCAHFHYCYSLLRDAAAAFRGAAKLFVQRAAPTTGAEAYDAGQK